MKVSFISTVFNEEDSIDSFLKSLLAQTKKPDEVIIVDGGSKDQTVDKIKKYSLLLQDKKIKFRLLVKRGNRSIGRNFSIKNARGDIIVCSDSGNILDDKWIENIIKPFKDKRIDVVAGFYQGQAATIFQKCLIPYVLVMEDRVDPETFLPATRSVSFRKEIWKKSGGFDEKLSHNEDYAFAKKLKEIGARIAFAKNAKVSWIPRENLRDAFVMFFRFAYGDAEAKLIRGKVVLVFARYFFGTYLLFLYIANRSFASLLLLVVLIIAYVMWSILKNYRYIKDFRAFYILPIIQLAADTAVISGTILGLLNNLWVIRK